MTSIVVHVKNQEEINLLKNFLDSMKFSFKTIPEEYISISEKEKQSISKGIDEANKGLLRDSSELQKSARVLCSE